MELEKLRVIIKEKRHTGADYRAYVGRAWRLIGNPNKLHAPLAYAAFEFRIAMERSLLELLYLIKKKIDGERDEIRFWASGKGFI